VLAEVPVFLVAHVLHVVQSSGQHAAVVKPAAALLKLLGCENHLTLPIPGNPAALRPGSRLHQGGSALWLLIGCWPTTPMAPVSRVTARLACQPRCVNQVCRWKSIYSMREDETSHTILARCRAQPPCSCPYNQSYRTRGPLAVSCLACGCDDITV
jgi:hypothetical protein